MKIQILSTLMLFAAVTVWAQEEPMKMKPEMTEIWDPEVMVVTPGIDPTEAPSDAIVLFDGANLENEWINSEG